MQLLLISQTSCPSCGCVQSHTVSLFSGLTSIMPFSKDWQSGGMKWGMWKTPLFTFSRSWRKLSWSKGRAPCRRRKKMEKKNRCDKINLTIEITLHSANRTYHQQSEEDDATAPHVCSTPIIFLTLKNTNSWKSTTALRSIEKKNDQVTKYHWEHGNTITAHKWNNSICDVFACSFVSSVFHQFNNVLTEYAYLY